MGFKHLLKKILPIGIDIAQGNYVGAAVDVVQQIQASGKKSQEVASVDAVLAVAAGVDDHQSDLIELRAELKKQAGVIAGLQKQIQNKGN
jgi:hypothetical protein